MMSAYNYGYNIGRLGRPGDNPYNISLEPTKYHEWSRGWKDGCQSRITHPINSVV